MATAPPPPGAPLDTASALPALGPLFNFFQLAYVVRDIERGTQQLGALYGIDRFRISRDVAIQTRDGTARLHFALAFLGSLQIEVIQPAGGADRIYRDRLPALGAAAQLHHVGHRVKSARKWEAVLRALAASRLAIPVNGVFTHEGRALMHYAYLDAREYLGHYLEFMYQTEAGRDLFADVPRYAASH